MIECDQPISTSINVHKKRCFSLWRRISSLSVALYLQKHVDFQQGTIAKCSQHCANRTLNIFTLEVISGSRKAAKSRLKNEKQMSNVGPLTSCSIYTTPALNGCSVFWPPPPLRLCLSWMAHWLYYDSIFRDNLFSLSTDVSHLEGAVCSLALVSVNRRGRWTSGAERKPRRLLGREILHHHYLCLNATRQRNDSCGKMDLVSCPQCFSPWLPGRREQKVAKTGVGSVLMTSSLMNIWCHVLAHIWKEANSQHKYLMRTLYIPTSHISINYKTNMRTHNETALLATAETVFPHYLSSCYWTAATEALGRLHFLLINLWSALS